MSIVYRLATNTDHPAIYDLGWQQRPLSFPTVVADDDGVIIGYMTTQPRKDQVVAGPLYVSPEVNTGHVAIELADFYGKILLGFGVTQYRLGSNTTKNGGLA